MQEFLMKCHTWDGSTVVGYDWMSEKLDGHRLFWDGGVTIGERVGWSSDISTGWWSNGGKSVKVPDSWTEALLDLGIGPTEGEAWAGRGRFQLVSSVVRATVSYRCWDDVKWYVTGPVPIENFLTIRNIKVRNKITGSISYDERMKWLGRYEGRFCNYDSFGSWYYPMKDLGLPSWMVVHDQVKLGYFDRLDEVRRFYESIVNLGGEGIMLRSNRLVWAPKRTNVLVKYKNIEDGEAVITGVVSGNGRLEGKIGALVVKWVDPINHKVVNFEIGTGMDDNFRNLRLHDLIGKMIRFRYRELTNDGCPKEARFVCLV